MHREHKCAKTKLCQCNAKKSAKQTNNQQQGGKRKIPKSTRDNQTHENNKHNHTQNRPHIQSRMGNNEPHRLTKEKGEIKKHRMDDQTAGTRQLHQEH